MAEKDNLSPLKERIATNISMHRSRNVYSGEMFFPLVSTDSAELHAAVDEITVDPEKTIFLPLKMTSSKAVSTRFLSTQFDGVWVRKIVTYSEPTRSSHEGNYGSPHAEQTYDLVGTAHVEKEIKAAEITLPEDTLR